MSKHTNIVLAFIELSHEHYNKVMVEQDHVTKKNGLYKELKIRSELAN